ncbi:MAG TPA: HupE/UreJ family protein [Candidatus Binatia bacterium]|nr:HupE/UreJ family protein [Candidatus Binatia bacterium]
MASFFLHSRISHRASRFASRIPLCIAHPASRNLYSGSRTSNLISSAALFLLLTLPVPAEAHLVNTGLGPFYDGVSHLFIAPEDLLVVLALGLLAGLGGPQHGRVVLFSLTGAWIAGGLVGLTHTREIAFPLGTMVSFVVAGALVALDRKLPLAAILAFSTLLGLLHGWLNGTAMIANNSGWLGLVGVSASVFVLAALLAAFVVWLQSTWARIGVRVAGSWIVAIGLLMVGWTVRMK